ncbi:NAD(+) diphosphatase [Pontibacter ruber]|uniref:NAD(+) diphosphatase n=1 Tax=Pontibacter ruber TaxID=1343895 RepID=A0ABW5CXZ5_9BACT|nr:NAD(+) diphosphatase [Pontibacter ruber]
MNFFSDNILNRHSELRTNAAFIQGKLSADTTRFILVCDNKSLVLSGEKPKAALLQRHELGDLLEQAGLQVFLGVEDEVAYFALGLDGMQDQVETQLGQAYTFTDLKTVALQMPRKQSALLAYARAMVHWNLRHLFCADCGNPTQSSEAGHVRKCKQEGCGKSHFPRTDTAVIVLISEGDACLLGRGAAWPEGRYATVAGFLEPGETLEQAVAREAQEETGVALESIRYHSSQPWPFPASIMVGFMATASNRHLQVDYTELEDARWFTRDEIVEGLQNGTLILPPRVSISYNLIRDWFDQLPGYQLEKFLRQEQGGW